MSKIELYTDGAAKGNPGPGGYGVVLRFGKNEKELSDGFRRTTNNRMELLALIVGLEALTTKNYPVEVYSDSKYVIDAITKKWVYNWQTKQFKGKKNKDLWLRFLKVSDGFRISYHWIKGHSGHPENERCDQLAVAASEGRDLKIDTVYEATESEEENNLFD